MQEPLRSALLERLSEWLVLLGVQALKPHALLLRKTQISCQRTQGTEPWNPYDSLENSSETSKPRT
ncbi:hypothetical protein X556_0801 [Chlamydia pneumoniae B21]|nr:hypothetical protein X556_0801 [Chlamydia pneumoniae B21]